MNMHASFGLHSRVWSGIFLLVLCIRASTWIILYKQQAYFSTIDEQVSLKQNVRFDKLAPGLPSELCIIITKAH